MFVRSAFSVRWCSAALVAGIASSASVTAQPKFDAQAWLADSADATIEVVAYKADEPWVDTPLTRVLTVATAPEPEQMPRNSAAVLAEELAERFGAITTATLRQGELSESSRASQPAAYRDTSSANYVLEVSLANAVVTYERRQLSSYGYRVRAKVRLIDNSASAVLWQYNEGFKPQWDDPRLHLAKDEIAADGSGRLREIVGLTLELIADDVVRAFREGPAER